MEEYGVLFRPDKAMYFAGYADQGAPLWVDELENAIYLGKTQLDKTKIILDSIFNVSVGIKELS